MKITNALAASTLRAASLSTVAAALSPTWLSKIQHFSTLCEEGSSKTHIAFLGTAILAKAVNPESDLFAIKPKHAQGNAQAYSARTLCHGVLVPLAAELGFSLGVTGREPLNNQPYFRMNYLGDDTPVHAGGRAAFDFMLELVRELQTATASEALEALRCFVFVRRSYLASYSHSTTQSSLSFPEFVAAVENFVDNNSEGGRRAQAVAAGLFDVFAGPLNVESGRINDPSRKYPGDVCIRATTMPFEVREVAAPIQWEKAVEVRDKPVSASDIQIFAAKCLSMGVREAAVLMVSPEQPELDQQLLQSWAATFGLGLTLFNGWAQFIDQVLFWTTKPKPELISEAVSRIEKRLAGVEALPNSLTLWRELTRS